VHDPERPCFAERLLGSLVPALIRSGDIAEATVLDLADQFDAEARHASIERAQELADMAAALRAWAIEAAGPTRSEWLAERARSRLRVVESPPVGGSEAG
jgi:uncharacterized caspase-like protein